MDHPEEHTIAKINNLQTQIDNLLSIVVEIKMTKLPLNKHLKGRMIEAACPVYYWKV